MTKVACWAALLAVIAVAPAQAQSANQAGAAVGPGETGGGHPGHGSGRDRQMRDLPYQGR